MAEEKKPNKSGAEKPVSLWGASFEDVWKALLKTEPMPKGKKDDKPSNERQGDE